MDDDNLIQRILDGKAPTEAPADILYMCLATTMMRLAGSREPVRAAFFYKYLANIGEILCPIFTPVKPPDYVEEMVEARLSYTGIAQDAELQAAFSKRMLTLVREGLVNSLERAIEANLGRQLRRNIGKEGLV